MKTLQLVPFIILLFIIPNLALTDSTYNKFTLGMGTLKNDAGFAYFIKASTDGITGMDKSQVMMESEIETAISNNYPGNQLQYFLAKTVPVQSEIEGEFDLTLRYAPIQLYKDSSLKLNRSLTTFLIGIQSDYQFKGDENSKYIEPVVHLWNVTFDAVGFSHAQLDSQRKFTGISIVHPRVEGGLHTSINDRSAIQIIGIADASFSSGTFSSADNSVKLSAVGIQSNFSIETQYLFDALKGHNIIFLKGAYDRLDYVNTTDTYQKGEWSTRLGYARRF